MSDAMLKLYVSAKTFTIGDAERGASLVEYALLVALIAVAAMVAIGTLGDNTNAAFEDIGDQIGGG